MIDRDFELMSEEHMKSMTKPEGPAQELRCPMCGYTRADAQLHGDHHLCTNAGNAPWEAPWANSATPAPSQPAGAREFIESRQFALEAFMHWLAGQCESYARQQTAAKDTEIERLTRKLESAGNAAKRERDRAEAAERERDSLREAVVKHGLRHTEECCLNRVPSKCDCGATDIRAALKAGKDGQQ